MINQPTQFAASAVAAANDNLPTLTPPPSAPSARLLKGECIAMMSAMTAASVDLVVTSPPYMNIGMEYGDAFDTIEDYIEFSRQWITAAAHVLKPGGAMWINVGMHKAGPNSRVPLTYYLFPLIAETGLTLVQEIVWDRRAQQNTTQRFATRSERWLYLVKPGALKGGRGRPKNLSPTFNLDDVRRPSTSADKRNNPAGANPADIWEFTQVHGTSKERTAHPCPFPQAMIERIVLACSNPGDVVLDPFGGSGTTGAAALAHGRSAVMIERESNYWPIIEKRLGLVDRVVVGSTVAGAELFADFHYGDAIVKMKLIPSKSVNLILCDPPFGTTNCSWDQLLPAGDMWREYERILAPDGMIVLHAAQPFTTDLIMSNRPWFSQHLIWEKTRPVGFYHAKRRHMAAHEDILVFKHPRGKTTFNPQGVVKKDAKTKRLGKVGEVYRNAYTKDEWVNDSSGYPRSVLKFASERNHGHPTQKPQALAEYLIRTFSNPGDVVLDHCYGSGTTGAAAMVTGRSFIGVERDASWFQKGRARILAAAGAGALPTPTVAANDDAAKATDDRSRPAKSSIGTTKRVARRATIANDNRPNSDVIRYATVCSGIEGVSLAWEPLGGFEPAFFSEVERFPNAVLNHHWPHVPNLGDMLGIDGLEWRGKLDVLWGSSPCQSFSRIGKRLGMADARGELTRKFVDLADEIDPEFIILENVKGLLSDQDNAFGCYLGALVGAADPLRFGKKRWPNFGYVTGFRRHVAWRVLDAQHGDVAQHRERVFVVGCPRNGPDPREVLFEQESEGRHSETAAGKARHREAHVAARLGDRHPAIYLNADATPKWAVEQSYTLRAAGGSGGRACVVVDGKVREIIPEEREGLMGIPVGHTNIPWPGKARSLDVARYKAIGNSLAIPDVRWLGERIKLARAIHRAGINLPLAA